MANIDDLDYKSLTDRTTDENLELLRQIRLSRRTPVKQVKTKTITSKKPNVKVNPNQAAELLRILQGE